MIKRLKWRKILVFLDFEGKYVYEKGRYMQKMQFIDKKPLISYQILKILDQTFEIWFRVKNMDFWIEKMEKMENIEIKYPNIKISW